MRVCIIAGGAQGLGKAMARHFLNNNWSVCVGDIDKEAGDIMSREEKGNDSFTFVHMDVSQENGVKLLVQTTIDKFQKINCLINNAALSYPYNGKIEELELDQWNKVINVNLTSAFLCSKHCIPFLKKEKGSNIINISSTRALMSESNHEAYATTKGGLISFTHALSISLQHEIMVNCISPGWIETGAYQKIPKQVKHTDMDKNQHPSGRVGEPKDVSDMAYFLATQNGFITGQNFVIDGGMTKKMIYSE
jgi:NAD(P)-dependent dehydrogenase (short-subunit alcohol dehydrogenase family)